MHKNKMSYFRYLLLVTSLATAIALYWAKSPHALKLPHAVDVVVPKLSEVAITGEKLFGRHCAICHGANAGGGETGPPLVHRIYEPSHHADGSFYLAVKLGVRAHHWRFGNMPPVPGVSKEEVTKIIRYVRELQRANNIY